MNTQGHINTFTKGMDKDTAYTKYSNMHYEHAENLRVTTSDGLTTGALVNAEGNEKFVDIPQLTKIKILKTSGTKRLNITLADGTVYNISFTIVNGEIVPANASINFFVNTLGATVYNITDESYLIQFTEEISDVTGSADIEIKILKEPSIIGNTTVRDDIILFTTDSDSKTGDWGQIWRVKYDISTLENTISLIYAHELNFSKRYLIEAVGRYETSNIQKIYWTDNYNKLRYLNIQDPDRFSIKPDFIDLASEVTLEPAVTTEIGSNGTGVLTNGTYQVSYRLNTKSGNSSVIAPWSIPISINSADETVEHWNYQRCSHEVVTLKANKSLTFKIDNVPTEYDYIDIYLLKRGTSEGVLYSVTTLTIDKATTYNYTITGGEGDFQEVFKDEIENFNVIFDTVKTINIKDNRLLIGNVTESSVIIEYDAEAPRYTRTGQNHNQYTDKVNPFNKDSTRDYPYNNPDNYLSNQHNPNLHYKWQNGKAVLGGTGDNISYSFINKSIVLDTIDASNSSNYTKFPLVHQPKTLQDITINGKTYNAGGLWNNYRNPYIEHLIAGYQRSEVYRFGILFYDKYSRPLDVKWIGDIRMPEVYENNIFSVNNDGHIIGNVLGIKFEVDISSVRDKISAFSIVRSPRPNKDKSILGQGLINDVARVSNNHYFISRNITHYDTAGEVNDEPEQEALDTATTYATNDVGDNLSVLTEILVNNEAVLMPANRLGERITDDRLEGVTLYDRVITFDSPQLYNGYGNPQLYGNIIGDETQGIYSQFKSGLKLRPVYGLYGGLNVQTNISDYTANEEDDPNYDSHIISREYYKGAGSYWATPTGVLPTKIPCYLTRPNKTSLFKDDSSVNPNRVTTRDPILSAIDIDGAIKANEYLDNFQLSNYTNTDLLALSNTNDRLKFHSIDINSRSNSNSNTILIGLKEHIAPWYNKVYSTGNPSSPTYYINNTTSYLKNLGGQGKIVANLYRENPGQYGGDTQLNIVESTYISTGHYQRVDEDSPNTFTCEVFGGDTFINYHQLTKDYASDRVNSIPIFVAQNPGKSIVEIFPDMVNNNGGYTNYIDNHEEWVYGEKQSLRRILGLPNNWNDYGAGQAVALFDRRMKALLAASRYASGIAFPIESTVNIDMTREKTIIDYFPKEEVLTRKDDLQNNIYSFLDVNNKPTAGNIYPFGLGEFYIDHTYKYRLKEDLGAYQAEDYSKTFIALNEDNIISAEFDNRIYASDVKINGERLDSWTSFKLNNRIEVDGHHGPINKIEIFNDTVLFLQDKGFGVVAVNPRSVVTDSTGGQLELGVGNVLHDYTYISTEIGCRHQWGVVKSKNGVYFLDANSRKFYRFSNRAEGLSDIKGMSSFFYNEFKGSVLKEDNILTSSGIATGYDPRFSEIFFTYRDYSKEDIEDITKNSTVTLSITNSIYPTATLYLPRDIYNEIVSGASFSIRHFITVLGGKTGGLVTSYDMNGTVYEEADIVSSGIVNKQYINPTTNQVSQVGVPYITINLTNFPEISDIINGWEGIDSPYIGNGPNKRERVFEEKLTVRTKRQTYVGEGRNKTIVYSEPIDAFSGFYSFTPTIYITDYARFFTPNPNNPKSIYIHNKGNKCQYYDNDPSPSILRTIVNPKGLNNKVFNNIEYLSQLTDTDGNDILDETFNTLKVYNEYQTTEKDIVIYGNPLLTVDQIHARRRMRNWRMQVPRSGAEKARIRNPYTTMEFTYNNNDNKKLVLNDIITYYFDVPM